jgi:hypothetical protein
MVRSKDKAVDIAPMSTSPAREGSANAGSSNGNAEEKPRLSEHEKKANHIASGKGHFVSYLRFPCDLVKRCGKR